MPINLAIVPVVRADHRRGHDKPVGNGLRLGVGVRIPPTAPARSMFSTEILPEGDRPLPFCAQIPGNDLLARVSALDTLEDIL